jgi:lysophospholipase L1-like esterase
MKSLSPLHSLLLLLSIGSVCLVMMWVWPAEGIGWKSCRLRFAQWSAKADSTQIKLDINRHMAHLDSIAIADSLKMLRDTIHVQRTNSLTAIQFKDGVSTIFHDFFEALDSAQYKNVDIFHYGDSQIECDRITQILRSQLQQKFGGYGPGIIAPVPLVATSNILQSQSDNWKRCTAYGFHDTKVKHQTYGAMCSFGIFDCIAGTDSTKATLDFSPTRFGDVRNKTYHELHVYFRNTQSVGSLRIYSGQSLLWSGQLPVLPTVQDLQIAMVQTPATIQMEFTAIHSPEIHGVMFEEKNGVTVNNIALRGSDGMLFTRTDLSAMGAVFAKENPRLIILQFGGNSVPYLKSKAHAQNCADQMALQIKALRKQAPKAAFLVIGPSDMSTSIDGVFQSFPFVAAYNDALREMALANDCAFWDMYAVMGGHNSMVAWVQNQPPYAGPDYTHFTPLGARKIGDLLSKALWEEYRLWQLALQPASNAKIHDMPGH